MATACMDGFKDFTKAEEMNRLALDGYEKSRGRIIRARSSVHGT